MNIAVFCAANDVAEEYVKDAKELALLLGANGHTLVWGAENRGLMKVMADNVQAKGGKLVGVTREGLEDRVRPAIDELVVAKDNRERNEILIKRADAIVALPGGLGTLNEVTEVLRMKKWEPEKMIVLLNTNSFFDGLKTQLHTMAREGFLTIPLKDVAFFAATPEEAINHIR